MKFAALLLVATSAVSFAADRQARYVLILQDKPVAAQFRSSKQLTSSAAADRAASIQSRQAEISRTLERRGVVVEGASQLLINALYVHAPVGSERQLRALPGVVYVEQDVPVRRHLMGELDLIRIQRAWTAANGSQNAGAGVKIAVLDSGIDNTHAAFNDGTFQYPEGFPKCRQDRGDCAYVNRKVVAARSYVSMLAGAADEPEFTRPDDLSPRDRSGHGTAVAAVAAGVRNSGPAGEISGVAPGAWLGNYKIFGSPGVNGTYTTASAVVTALEDAIQDGMDIAVLALGAPAFWGPRDQPPTCGGSGPCDFRAQAVENAVANGMTVVVSAGNSADAGTRFPSYNSIESPGTAPSAITVGASTNSQILWQRVRLESPDAPAQLREINTLFGDGPKPQSGTLTAPLRDVSKVGDNGFACAPLTNGSLEGTIALIQRGECQLELKINHAQRAGAVGVIIYQDTNTQFVFRMQNLDTTGIPAVLIGNRNGLELKEWLNSHPDASVTLDTALVVVNAPSDADLMAYFSSRGPSIRETAIKPEVTAPGTDFYVPVQNYDPNGDMYNADRYTVANGTSFAAPMVAGVAAIVKQLHPNWAPADIKSAIVNTADPRLEDLDANDQVIEASVLDAGAGIVDAGNAVQTNLTISPATASFGVWGETRPAARQLTFRNSSNQPVRLEFSVVRPSAGTARVVLESDSANVTVPANGTANVRLSIEGDRPPPGVYEGEIVVNTNPTLRVPYVFFVADGTPFNILPIRNQGFEGDPGAERTLTFKVTDRFGLPVSGLRFDFQPTLGGGRVVELALSATDDLGVGEAIVELGPQIGEQEFFARVGDDPNFGIFFGGYVRPTPVIESGGVRNAASGQEGVPVAPGSYVAIYGRGLSPVQKIFTTPYLPLSLSGVSVSFDVPSQNVSMPGRIHFVSDRQINVQIPWELQGISSALMKVSIGDTSSAVYELRLRDHSPAVFEYSEAGTGRLLAAARDERLELIGTGNPGVKGRTVVLYVNGLGPVDGTPVTGEAAPSDQLIRTRAVPTVTVGGRPAVVDFSGLAPGAAGLYQINLRLADDTPSGLQPVVVAIGGVESKTATLPVQ